MELCDLTDLKQFGEYYMERNLNTLEEKIDNLRDTMKIIGIRYEKGNRKPEELLALLEESALLGYWRATNDDLMRSLSMN